MCKDSFTICFFFYYFFFTIALQFHANQINIIPATQSGFRSNHCCTTALLEIVDNIISSTDQQKLTTLVLLDYTKAFDRINHQLLLAMLHYYGFNANSEALMKSYLTDRQQEVIVNNKKSQVQCVYSGVPQGSILGPLMFIIYTSNLKNSLRHCSSHFYADDTQIYYSFSVDNKETVSNLINGDLERLIKASENICLAVNPSKSSLVVFGPKKQRQDCANNIRIIIGDNILKCNDVCKNLGMYLDTSLRFSTHVTFTLKKAYTNLKLLYGSNFLLDKKTKIMLCNSLVLSHFNYGDVVYNTCLTLFDKIRIQRVQNSCARFIFHVKKYESISSKILQLGWLNMSQRRCLHSCVLYHKIICTKYPKYLYDKIEFRYNIHSLNTRGKTILSPPMHRTSIFERSFKFNIYKLYNAIPQEIKLLGMIPFKNRLSQLIFKQEFTLP